MAKLRNKTQQKTERTDPRRTGTTLLTFPDRPFLPLTISPPSRRDIKNRVAYRAQNKQPITFSDRAAVGFLNKLKRLIALNIATNFHKGRNAEFHIGNEGLREGAYFSGILTIWIIRKIGREFLKFLAKCESLVHRHPPPGPFYSPQWPPNCDE